MVHFVGAGPGAKDLITMRGKRLLEEADLVVYAGSLVNKELLEYAKDGCRFVDSAPLSLEEIIEIIKNAADDGLSIVRLHSGDPSIYGAIREQMDRLKRLGIECDVCPGVSACFGAAASLGIEYTLPGISQSLVITRLSGRTKVPEAESIESFAKHGCSMAIYLSAGHMDELSDRLLLGGLPGDTPAAIVYKATWPEERSYFCTVSELGDTARENGITRTALVLVGDALPQKGYERSVLYGMPI